MTAALIVSNPLGAVDRVEEKGRGIVRVLAGKRAAIYLPPGLNALVSERDRVADGWYAGELALAVVAITFPELFHINERRLAARVVAMCGRRVA